MEQGEHLVLGTWGEGRRGLYGEKTNPEGAWRVRKSHFTYFHGGRAMPWFKVQAWVGISVGDCGQDLTLCGSVF